ncbi:MAG: hypothetical protein ACE5JG_00670 [Planctomycetota bacterium]
MTESTGTFVEIEGFGFPPFDLVRLMRTVFDLEPQESFGVFTDLPDPRRVAGLAFLQDSGLEPQHHAWHTLHQGLVERRAELGGPTVSFHAYRETGGPNLDLPDTVFTVEGEERPLRRVLAEHTIVLYVGRWSATAPITALAKELGLRGATMHGVNDRILATGLAVDYEQVSARAERLRRALTRADRMRMEWRVRGASLALDVHLGGQEAQKSHGLVRERGDVANLPAGEVYYVPVGADGLMPRQFEDAAETIAVFEVQDGLVSGLRELVRGDRKTAEDFLRIVESDPNAGRITELGLGTQDLPFAGSDIQDEKILGTAHVATGRSDHLGGDVDSAAFRDPRNASHNDILYTPRKTPEVELTRVTMIRNGEETPIVEGYRPTAFLRRHI